MSIHRQHGSLLDPSVLVARRLLHPVGTRASCVMQRAVMRNGSCAQRVGACCAGQPDGFCTRETCFADRFGALT